MTTEKLEKENLNSAENPSVLEEITSPEIENSPITDHEEEELDEIELPLLETAQPSNQDLLSYLKKLKSIISQANSANLFKGLEEILSEHAQHFENQLEQNKSLALEKFKADNEGQSEGFEFHPEPIAVEIQGIIQELRKLRHQFFKNLEEKKGKVIEEKTKLLAQLRDLVESEENANPSVINESFKSFKKIQENWKSLGNIAGAANQELWKNYHALVDRFYSNRSIYFELLELDRKKNQQSKESIAYQLEEIASKIQKETEDTFIKYIREAEILFEEYKHFGPAPKEINELLWNRVKKALDIIFDQKRQISEARKKLMGENLTIKEGLSDLMAEKAKFDSDSINDWNRVSKEVSDLQKQWEKVPGGLPKEKGRKISADFWANLKVFYKNKSKFFARLDSARKENADKKRDLIEKVKAIVEAKTYDPESTKVVLALQAQWKEIGHVPEKLKQNLFDEFKKACDDFFENRRSSGDVKGAEFYQNLKIKEDLIEELKKIQKDKKLLGNLSEIKQKWDETGFVPKRNLKKIMDDFRTQWNKAIDLANTLGADELAEYGIVLNSNEEGKEKGHGDSKKKIQLLENEIATLKNNLEFFSMSKNAEKLIKDVEDKIAKAELELKKLIEENNK